MESYFASDFAIDFAKQILWKQNYVTNPLIFDTYTHKLSWKLSNYFYGD